MLLALVIYLWVAGFILTLGAMKRIPPVSTKRSAIAYEWVFSLIWPASFLLALALGGYFLWTNRRT